MLLQTGIVRLALLATVDGVKVSTAYLPPPSVKGMNLEWDKKASTKDLVTGGERTRVRGYLPVLTCTWSVYDERPHQGYVIGTGNGQRPGLEDLLGMLSQPTGMLRVSPGPSAGGFTVDSVQVRPLSKEGDFYTGLQAVFRGRDPLPSMTLGVF
jgi:hypothetical protein